MAVGAGAAGVLAATTAGRDHSSPIIRYPNEPEANASATMTASCGLSVRRRR